MKWSCLRWTNAETAHKYNLSYTAQKTEKFLAATHREMEKKSVFYFFMAAHKDKQRVWRKIEWGETVEHNKRIAKQKKRQQHTNTQIYTQQYTTLTTRTEIAAATATFNKS